MTPVDRIVAALRAAGCDPRARADGSWESFCPSHEHNRSHRNLYVSEGDNGSVLLYCHGCGRGGNSAILASIGLTIADLFADDAQSRRTAPKPIKTPKSYRTADGAAAVARATAKAEAGDNCRETGRWQYPPSTLGFPWWVVRFDGSKGKSYRPIHQAGPADFRLGDPQKTDLPLYHSDRIVDADLVYIVEGEKCADALAKVKLCAVSPSHGAQSPHKSDWTPLSGKDVVIWPDNDEPGQTFATLVSSILSKLVFPPRSIRLVDPVKLKLGNKEDAADFIADRLAYGLDPKTILHEIEFAISEKPKPTKPAKKVEAVESPLSLDRQGLPYANMYNVCLLIESKNIWYNEFSDMILLNSSPWTDQETLDFTREIQCSHLPRVRKETVYDAVAQVARSKKRNPVREYLASLKWDGVKRISQTWPAYFGSVPSAYAIAVARNFWISLIARAEKPGCQLDNMVVLEGDQGLGKSQALRAIGGEWFAELTESVQTKDFFIALRGVWLAEIGELDSFSRAEVTRIKSVITCQVDRYRSPYDRCSRDHPRATVFAGSTNSDDWIRDPTGGRRFWPIKIGQINVEAIRRDRDQLFAEATVAFASGEPWWLTPTEETLAEQTARQSEEVWAPTIADWLDSAPVRHRPFVTAADVLTEAIKCDLARQDRAAQMRVSAVLRGFGWSRGWSPRSLGAPKRVWLRPTRTDLDPVTTNSAF